MSQIDKTPFIVFLWNSVTNVERSKARLQIRVPVLVVGVENAVPVIIFIMDVQDSVIVVILIVNVVPAQTFPQCTAASHNTIPQCTALSQNPIKALKEALRRSHSDRRRLLLGPYPC